MIKPNHFGTMTAAVAVVLAALLLTLAGITREAEATVHGENGKIAFASNRATGEGVNNTEGDFEIFTINQDGTGLVQLTENANFDFGPAWSADGEQITFESDRDLFSEIFVMNADGSDQERVTLNGAPRDSSPVFSPNGRKIAFETNRDGNFEIYKMRADGTRPINLTNDPADDFTPDWQPLETR